MNVDAITISHTESMYVGNNHIINFLKTGRLTFFKKQITGAPKYLGTSYILINELS